MRKLTLKLVGLVLLFFIVTIFSCKDDDPVNEPGDTTKTVIQPTELTQLQKDSITNMHVRGEMLSYMKHEYLWYDKIPVTTDTLKNVSPEDFFYSLLYTSLDQWSFIVSKKEYSDLMNGIYLGHGISFYVDNYGNFRIAFVFKNTTAYTKGIKRGWIVKKVNGIVPLSLNHFDELLGSTESFVTNNFEFLKPDGTSINILLTKESVTMNSVLAYNIVNVGNKKVGYIAVETFLGDILNEFNDVFLKFKNAGINELVIDLRYNGGGSLDASGHLANLVAGAAYSGSTFCKLYFNNLIDKLYTDQEKTIKIGFESQTINPGLERVFFITSSATASASETLIKGLEPFFETYVIGNRTHGKPVGMYNIELSTGDYILMPITFEWKNSLVQSCPYTGIPVNFQEFDDFTHELGDTSELCLKQAIHYIINSKFDVRKKSMPVDEPEFQNHLKGFRAEIGAY
jgi:carboxyl-terminal processing protease